jgi:hypothetical protein
MLCKPKKLTMKLDDLQQQAVFVKQYRDRFAASSAGTTSP